MSLTREDRNELAAEATSRRRLLDGRPAEALPAIVRCRVKGCKGARRVFALVRHEVKTDWRWGRVYDARKVIGWDDGFGNRLDVHGFSMAAQLPGGSCLPCGHKMTKVTEVKGTYSDKMTCGARCMNATGPSCECSCAGMNHGGRHGF